MLAATMDTRINSFAILLVLLSLVSATSSAPSIKYGAEKFFIIIDAGSTGNRLHVHNYTWPSPNHLLPVIWPSQNKKIKGGMSECATVPELARAKIAELLKYAREVLPDENDRRETPIHLQATAGLRSVTPKQADAVLAVIRDALSASEFLFEPEWALIIPGEDEGINGWLATNYLLGSFEPQTSFKPHGVVEMGGASMQITFAPSKLKKSDSQSQSLHVSQLLIAKQHYSLYTYSFLNYGLQAAQKVYQSLWMDEIEKDGNPCYPTGYRKTSSGDFDKCFERMVKVVDKEKECEMSPCSFNGIHMPVIENEPFLAIENFFYTSKFFDPQSKGEALIEGAMEISENKLVPLLKQAGRDYCDDPWPQIQADHPAEDHSALAYYCFASAYETAVLEQGFGFTTDSNLRSAKTVRGNGIEWELGSTLREILKKDKGENVVSDSNVRREMISQGQCNSLTCNIPLFILCVAIMGALVYCVVRALRSQRSHRTLGYNMLNTSEKMSNGLFNKV